MSVGFVLVVLAAFYYFDLRVAAAYAILAAGCYGLVMLSDDEIPARGVKFVIGVGALSAVAMIMVRLRRRTRALVGELDLAAHTDALTGLSNRRAFEERFEYEIARAERAGRPLGLVLIDIDGFKGLNDRLGHEEGDRALVRLADLLRSSIRRIDMASRLGGEEFAVIAPEAGADEALTLAERIRMGAVRRVGPPGEVSTVSCGVAAYPDLGRSEQELLRSADQALYVAKRGGRNRSEVGVIRPRFGNQDDDERPDDASAGSIESG